MTEHGVTSSTSPASADAAGPARDAAGPPERERADSGAGPRSGRRRAVAPAAGLLAVTCLWVLWRTGPGKVPNPEIFEIIARGWPTIPMGPETAYVLRVPLGQIAYGLLPREGTGTFLALHLACLFAAGLLLAGWLCARLGLRAGLVASAVLALAPVTAVLLLWIGMYDAFSILAWVFVLISLDRRGPWQFAAAVLAGVQNFEQVAVGLFMLLMLPALTRRAGLDPRAAWLLPGAVIGKIGLELYLRSVGATPGSRFTFLADWDTFSHLLGTTAANVPLIVWSALAGLWGFALTALLRCWPGWSRRQRVQLVLAVLAWAASSTITADHTRVLALTSFPLVVVGALVIADRWRDLRELVRLPQTWLLFLAPPVVVFDYITLQMGIKPDLWGVWIF